MRALKWLAAILIAAFCSPVAMADESTRPSADFGNSALYEEGHTVFFSEHIIPKYAAFQAYDRFLPDEQNAMVRRQRLPPAGKKVGTLRGNARGGNLISAAGGIVVHTGQIHDTQHNFRPDVLRRGVSSVSDLNPAKAREEIVEDFQISPAGHGQVGPNLGLTYLAGDVHSGLGGGGASQGSFRGVPGFFKGESDVSNADAGYSYSRAGEDDHPKRPTFHAALGVKIVLIAFVLAGGVYYFLYTLRNGGRLAIETVALYAILGVAGILISMAFAGLVLTGNI